jgi:hypothetical protein
MGQVAAVNLVSCMATCLRLEVVELSSATQFHGTKKPRRGGRGVSQGEAQIRSVAAVYEPPAQTPGGRNQAPHMAAAISADVKGRAADEDARATPAVVMMVMPAAMMPAVVPAAPGRGRCRHQRGCTQRCRGHCNEREFA